MPSRISHNIYNDYLIQGGKKELMQDAVTRRLALAVRAEVRPIEVHISVHLIKQMYISTQLL
jgi:hypothetical protein